MDDKKDSSKDDKDETPKEVDNATLNNLLNILIYQNDSKKNDLYHTIIFEGYREKEMIKIADLDRDTQVLIIELYASHNNMYKTVSGKETEACFGGAGFCGAVNGTDLNTILSKYDFKRTEKELFDERHIYNDLYLFTNGGWIEEYDRINHDISAKYEDEDIIVTDKAELFYNNTKTEKEEISYRFKTNDNKNYYLYSIEKKQM